MAPIPLQHQPQPPETTPDAPQVTDDEIPYPLDVWDGTAYGEYAKICGHGNYIPKELFVESLKTYVGAVVGDQIQLPSSPTGCRFYTVFILGGGKGKSTAFEYAHNFLGSDLLFTGGTPIYQNIGAYCGPFGSANGLEKAVDAGFSRVIIEEDEISTLVEKTAIAGSGQAYLNTLNKLNDSNRFVKSLTKTAKISEVSDRKVHLSIIGATTTSKWQTMFTTVGTVGSGFYQRLNITRPDDKDIRKVILDPIDKPIRELRESLRTKILALEHNPVTCGYTIEARERYTEEVNQLGNDMHEDVKGRIDSLVQKNAMHLAWLLDRKDEHGNYQIDTDILERAFRLAEYTLQVKAHSKPIEAENPEARHVLIVAQAMERKKYCSKTELSRAIHAERWGPEKFDRALSTLRGCDSVDVVNVPNGKGRPSKYIRWIGHPEF